MNADGIVSCDGALPGDTGVIEGITYTAVDKSALVAKLALEEDVTTVCTTPVTDLNGEFTLRLGVYSPSSGLFGPDFNQDIGSWDVSNVTQMIATFYGATAFNQDIDAWDVSNVTVMAHTFGAAESFNQDLNSWNVSSVTDMQSMFKQARAFNGDISDWDVSNVRIMHSMFRANASTSLIDPLCTPYCGGNFNRDISRWNTANVTIMNLMFSGQGFFDQPIGSWNTSNVGSMFGMFDNAIAFNQDIGGWDVSNVGEMGSMFSTAIAFNQDISGWDVSNVQSMANMFYEAKSFNQDIGNWNTAKVTNMGSMFMIALAFDQDIGGWDVSSARNMNYMFASAIAFNQDLSGWNVSNVTSMNSMFTGTWSFNQPLGTWDLSNVTDMKGMFSASAFNQDISGWNTAKVTDMSEMFYNNRVFNQDIGGWDTGNVTKMRAMFPYARAFNQDIGDWNTSKVTDMTLMFLNAETFNQDIGGWDVSSVLEMREMFNGARAFDQDLSSWDVSSVTTMWGMFSGSLSTSNYDALLNGWAGHALQNGVQLDIGSTRHTAVSAAARRTIAEAFGWTIRDGGIGLPIGGITGPRLMSSPRGGAVLSELLAPLWTQGMTGADTPHGTPNVWFYEQGAQAHGDAPTGWVPVADLEAHVVNPGQGFLVQVFTDTDFDGNDDLPVTLGVNAAGVETTQGVTLSDIGAGEWVLAGNPYAQTLDWDRVGKAGLEGTVYVYDAAYTGGHSEGGGSDAPAAPVGGWRTWNGVAGSLTDGLLAPFQGFFVQGGDVGGTLTLSMDHVAEQAGTFRKTSPLTTGGGGDVPPSGGHLTLTTRSSIGGSTLSDQAHLSFTHDGLVGRDPLDALKLLPLSGRERPLLLFDGDGLTWSTANLPLHRDPVEDPDGMDTPATLALPLQARHLLLDEEGRSTPAQTDGVLSWDATGLPDHVRVHLRQTQTGHITTLTGQGRLELATPTGAQIPSHPDNHLHSYPVLGDAPLELVITYLSTSTSVEDGDGWPGEDPSGERPRTLQLAQNHPNPFNPSTTLRFGLPEATPSLTLTVHDLLGRRVATLLQAAPFPAGWHSIEFDASSLPSGVYTCRLTTPRSVRTRTLTLLK